VTQAPTTDWGEPMPPEEAPPSERRMYRRGGAPSGPWGRPAKLAPRLAAEVIDLREAPRFTPPPPPAPVFATEPGAVAKRASRWLEVAAALLLLAGLAAVFQVHAPTRSWASRSAPGLAALARDVARPAPNAQLTKDVAGLRGIGPPVDPTARRAWEQALAEVTAAVHTTDTYQARQDLGVAGLDLTQLTRS
jgi:hypothetical protein